ncbi:unnamed protein product [Gordionus sp. m RMFG-2023]
MKSLLPKLLVKNSALFICDLQEKFRSTIQNFSDVVINSKKLIDVAKILQIPIIATEQYPKGLGKTVSEIDTMNMALFEKTHFSMCITSLLVHIRKIDIQNIILCGIETHVCIQQTSFELLENGYAVYLIADATSSRSLLDRKIALKLMSSCQVKITTVESIILTLLKDSANPNFKIIQKLLMKSSENLDFLY